MGKSCHFNVKEKEKKKKKKKEKTGPFHTKRIY